jgi:hypothetical protein
LKWFNLSLLAKWRWRFLEEDGTLWKNVFEAKYEGGGRVNLSIGHDNKYSFCWKDLVGLGKTSGVVGDWSQEIFIKKLGCGGLTSFWMDRWVETTLLCDTFP